MRLKIPPRPPRSSRARTSFAPRARSPSSTRRRRRLPPAKTSPAAKRAAVRTPKRLPRRKRLLPRRKRRTPPRPRRRSLRLRRIGDRRRRALLRDDGDAQTTVAEDPALDPEPAVAAPLVPRACSWRTRTGTSTSRCSSDALRGVPRRAPRRRHLRRRRRARVGPGSRLGRGEPHVPHAAAPGARAARADARSRAVAEAARRRGGRAARLPSLRVPSAPAFPAAPATLVVPRIAATDEMFGTKDRHRRDSTDVSSRSDKTFVFRQIIEYPAMSDAAVAALDRAVHAEADASLEHARVAPSRPAPRRALGRVLGGGAEPRRSPSSPRGGARKPRTRRGARRARRGGGGGEAAGGGGARFGDIRARQGSEGGAARRPAPPRGPKPFPPVSFFDVEEGREALRAIVTETDSFATRERVADETVRDEIPLYSDRRTLPPRRAAGSLPPSVRLAAPEPRRRGRFVGRRRDARIVRGRRPRRRGGDHRGSRFGIFPPLGIALRSEFVVDGGV